jgi:hypothetical protein
MTADLAESLVPLAAELVGSVRDFGPDAVADVLSRVPDGRHDALAVILAAMVDPDARPRELLAWTDAGPVQSRSFEPAVHRLAQTRPCPDCGAFYSVRHMARHRRTHKQAVA